MTTVFIAVDVQRDFCEGGSLPVPGGNAVAERIGQHIKNESGPYFKRVATKDFHRDPGEHFGDPPDYVDTWPRHCVIGTEGTLFAHGLTDSGVHFDATFLKGRDSAAYSGFEGEGSFWVPEESTHRRRSLKDFLDQHEVTDIVIGGLALDYCVKATALDGLRYEYGTVVRLDLTAPVTPETGEKAIEELVSEGVILEGEPQWER